MYFPELCGKEEYTEILVELSKGQSSMFSFITNKFLLVLGWGLLCVPSFKTCIYCVYAQMEEFYMSCIYKWK